MAKRIYQNPWLRLLLVVVLIYCATYVMLGRRGYFEILEEGSSTRRYYRIMPTDSYDPKVLLLNPTLTLPDIRKLAEKEERRQLRLKIVFGPAMWLHSLCLDAVAGQP